jgi:hypothetical protein
MFGTLSYDEGLISENVAFRALAPTLAPTLDQDPAETKPGGFVQTGPER